jgi:hypothetical protein
MSCGTVTMAQPQSFRLKNVQHFADAGPEQFRLRQAGQEFFALAHLRHRVNAGVRDAAGEHGHDRRHFGIQRLGDPATCSKVRMAVTLSFTPSNASSRMSGSDDSPRVLVMGILT